MSAPRAYTVRVAEDPADREACFAVRKEAARARGLTAVDLHAQTHALGFYERLGYVAYGPEDLEAGIAHRSMRRSL